MKKYAFAMMVGMAMLAPAFSQDDASVQAVIDAVRAKNPDAKELCQKGEAGIRQAVTDAMPDLVRSGKVSGNPRQVGGMAGMKIGMECTKG